MVVGALLASGSTLLARPPVATEPAPPHGYESAREARDALLTGRIRPTDLLPPVPEGVKITPNVEYGRVGDRSLQLDLYEPREHPQPVPAMILIHGGGWKKGQRGIYRAYCLRLAARGYVAATISYRLSGEAPYPAAVQDAKCAVRWMRASASKHGVDPDKIGVLGASAGGHLSLMVGYTPNIPELEGEGGHNDVSSRVQAVIDYYGPTDLTVPRLRDADLIVSFLGGKHYEEARAQYCQASPIIHIARNTPPTLVLHGTIDELVPVAQSDQLVKKLKESGVPCEYERLEGWPHAMDLSEDVSNRCWWRVERFLDKYLPLPNAPATRSAAR
jgi:acetyl esterase/lipase